MTGFASLNEITKLRNNVVTFTRAHDTISPRLFGFVARLLHSRIRRNTISDRVLGKSPCVSLSLSCRHSSLFQLTLGWDLSNLPGLPDLGLRPMLFAFQKIVNAKKALLTIRLDPIITSNNRAAHRDENFVHVSRRVVSSRHQKRSSQ
jgi:hypothetical protein